MNNLASSNDLSVLPHLFTQSQIYINLDLWIFLLYFESLSNTSSFCWFPNQKQLLGALSGDSSVHLTHLINFFFEVFLTVLESAIFPKSLATTYWRMILEIKTWASCMLVVTGAFSFSLSQRTQLGNICEYDYPCVYTNVLIHLLS